MRGIVVVLLCMFSVTATAAPVTEDKTSKAIAAGEGAPPQPVTVPLAPPAPPPPVAVTGTGPVAVPPPVPAVPDALPPLDLARARLYVYDFLDIREKVYQSKVLDEIERQLMEWLTPRVGAATILRSRQTPFVLKRDADSWQADISTEHEVDRVPVRQTIASNLSAEEQFGADHRLIIFPSSFTVSGVWRFYTIRFVLIREADQKTWQYVYEGSHAVMLKEGERSKSRAEKIIQKLDAAMTADGLLDVTAPDQKSERTRVSQSISK